SPESASLSFEFDVTSPSGPWNIVFDVSSSVFPSLERVAFLTNFARPMSPEVSLPSRLNVLGPPKPPPMPRPGPPPGPAPPGAPPAGDLPPFIFSSIVISFSVCVITQETLSAFCIRPERPWLLLLSSVQVPAKLGAAACTARAITSALIRLRAQNNFLIQDLL